eukprot:1181790-Prorocentrum_minimum.AAC.6
MSIAASFAFPGNVEKSITVAKGEAYPLSPLTTGLLSTRIGELKTECMKVLGEYLESQNINVAEAEKGA